MASSAAPQVGQHVYTRGLDPDRRCLPGFLLCGILMSFLSAILPAWGYHLKADFREVGEYFLTLYLGFLLSLPAAPALLFRGGLKFTLLSANALACGGFLLLAFWSPPLAVERSLAGVFLLGVSAGLLGACVFRRLSPLYEHDRAGTVNLASTLFGVGCLVTALLVAGTYYAYPVRGILILFATLPCLYAIFAARGTLTLADVHSAASGPDSYLLAGPSSAARPSATYVTPLRSFQGWQHLNEPGIVLLGLLLFVQFGNEWSIAGWLSLFLIRRLGISPEDSLLLLALYWTILLVGRIVWQILLRKISHALMLTSSVFSSLLGILVLASTNNRFGAGMGILFVGTGFASVFPLVVEKTRHRFPTYGSGLFATLVSLAMTGAFLAPWLLGYLAERYGIRAVMIAPLLGTCGVLLLIWLIMLEAKLNGSAWPN